MIKRVIVALEQQEKLEARDAYGVLKYASQRTKVGIICFPPQPQVPDDTWYADLTINLHVFQKRPYDYEQTTFVGAISIYT
ncbi:hypothetical protein DPMN_028028 [Dreissena polymorpha]|uniref:Uncharacterized protein n=1 Tax=Dreissena polymorpha TaxID=45954 RepID=A0A9D4LW88_DREPO|nr:hypothetical protein DPMN_028028 [Dreissena polymorpha]